VQARSEAGSPWPERRLASGFFGRLQGASCLANLRRARRCAATAARQAGDRVANTRSLGRTRCVSRSGFAPAIGAWHHSAASRRAAPRTDCPARGCPMPIRAPPDVCRMQRVTARARSPPALRKRALRASHRTTDSTPHRRAERFQQVKARTQDHNKIVLCENSFARRFFARRFR
jgi:hypothetical protein